MTRLFPFLFLCVLVLGIASCSDSTDGPKVAGCMDSLSVNYNKLANTDDGSCVFPSDKLVGTWKVKDEVSSINSTTLVLVALPTVNSNATVTKSDKKVISIKSDRPDNPTYIYKGALTIDWKNKKIDIGPGTSLTGTIVNENSFTLSYVYGASSTAYTVKQTFTR